VAVAAVVRNLSASQINGQITADPAMRAFFSFELLAFIVKKFGVDDIKRAVTDGAAVC